MLMKIRAEGRHNQLSFFFFFFNLPKSGLTSLGQSFESWMVLSQSRESSSHFDEFTFLRTSFYKMMLGPVWGMEE